MIESFRQQLWSTGASLYTYASDLAESIFPSYLHFNKIENKLRHFRTFDDIKNDKNVVNKTGSEGHKVSGSGQFSGTTIQDLINKVRTVAETKHTIIIINLREESTGFINREPIVWKTTEQTNGNKGLSLDKIEDNEYDLLDRLNRIFFAWKRISYFKGISFLEKREFPIPVFNRNALTEKQVVDSLNYDDKSNPENRNFWYYRFPITDHEKPSDEVVDQIVKVIIEHPNEWLHFHGEVGMGRTTTALAMYDMIHNAKNVSLEDILARQKAIGGQDLAKTPSDWRKEIAKERFEFLKNFYNYCKEINFNTDFRLSWSEFNKPIPY